MKFLRDLNDKMAPKFNKGEKLERFYPLFEAHDTGSFTPGIVTKAASHIRDALDQKRMMIMVVFALLPCFLMAMFSLCWKLKSPVTPAWNRLDGCP